MLILGGNNVGYYNLKNNTKRKKMYNACGVKKSLFNSLLQEHRNKNDLRFSVSQYY